MSELATLMKHLGCLWALNMDGGKSSTMVIENQVVNKPKRSSGKKVANAIIIRKKNM